MRAPLVMMVDDDADTCAAVTELLEDSGFQTITARSGRLALERLRATPPPDVILIDLQMPDMGGAALCAACDAVPELAQIPRVVISGDRDLSAVECRARALVAKPMRAEQLLRVLAEVLGGPGSWATPLPNDTAGRSRSR